MSCDQRRIQGLDCCHPENPFANDKRICCDCDGRCCGFFEEKDRDCFWPDFTHPSWLCCRILYGCETHERCPRGEFPARNRGIDETNIIGPEHGCSCHRG